MLRDDCAAIFAQKRNKKAALIMLCQKSTAQPRRRRHGRDSLQDPKCFRTVKKIPIGQKRRKRETVQGAERKKPGEILVGSSFFFFFGPSSNIFGWTETKRDGN